VWYVVPITITSVPRNIRLNRHKLLPCNDLSFVHVIVFAGLKYSSYYFVWDIFLFKCYVCMHCNY